jgi:large subunit ribosomal protein L19
MDAINYIHEELKSDKGFPAFGPGDNIEVGYRIIEGDKERIQKFRGDVLQIKGEGATKTFTVRKNMSHPIFFYIAFNSDRSSDLALVFR